MLSINCRPNKTEQLIFSFLLPARNTSAWNSFCPEYRCPDYFEHLSIIGKLWISIPWIDLFHPIKTGTKFYFQGQTKNFWKTSQKKTAFIGWRLPGISCSYGFTSLSSGQSPPLLFVRQNKTYPKGKSSLQACLDLTERLQTPNYDRLPIALWRQGKSRKDRGPECVLQHKAALAGRTREAATHWILVRGTGVLLLLLQKLPPRLRNQGWNWENPIANKSLILLGI